jgi:hypothetical protein
LQFVDRLVTIPLVQAKQHTAAAIEAETLEQENVGRTEPIHVLVPPARTA